jgi:uncharacterized membrane protein
VARIARLQGQEALRPVGEGPVVTLSPPASPPRRQEPKEKEPEGTSGPAFPPRWVPLASSVICLLAFADSAYLTYAHYTSVTVLACPTNGFVDCAAVTTSAYSHPFGIPVAVAGLAWSFVMGVLCSPWGWRSAEARWWPWASRARVAGSVAGVGMVFYLLWAELIKLRHLCEYCTVMHVLTIALFVIVAFGTALAEPAEPEVA